MSSLNKVRLADGREFAISEVYHQPRFSTVELAAADSVQLSAFNYTPGQPVSHTASLAVRTATERDTNMVKRKAMNQDESLIVCAITYEVFGLSSATDNSGNSIALAPMLSGTDLRRLQTQGVFALKVGAGIKKPQYEIPFAWLSQSVGMESYASPSGSTATRVDYGTAGEMSARNQEVLQLPIYIGGFGEHARPGNSMYFEGKFYNPLGTFTGLRQNVRIVFYLDGLAKRPA